MRLSQPVAAGLSLLALSLPAPAQTPPGAAWKTEAMEGGTRLSACTGVEQSDCVVFLCPEGGPVRMEVQLPLVSDLRGTTALMGVDEVMSVAQSFAADADAGILTATFTAPDPGALVQAMAGGTVLTLRFSDARLAGLDSLTAFPLTGAAEAVAGFTAACPQIAAPMAADAGALPSFADEPADDALPSFADEPAPEAAPEPDAATAEAAMPSQPPAGFVKGMPLTFAPDPAAGPATPDDAPGRFVTTLDASVDAATPVTIAQAFMAQQQIDFAARYGGVPEITGDMVVFTDGRLILTVRFCVAGKTGDEGCETWTMVTIGGGEPFAVSTKGLPSDRPLWIDLQGAGVDGWPDLLAQDAVGGWTRFSWTGAGYF